MLSSVRPGSQLQQSDIPIILESPGAGKNLQDHLYIYTGWRATVESLYNANISGLRKYRQGFKYLLTHCGYLELGYSQVAAFDKSSTKEEQRHPFCPQDCVT